MASSSSQEEKNVIYSCGVNSLSVLQHILHQVPCEELIPTIAIKTGKRQKYMSKTIFCQDCQHNDPKIVNPAFLRSRYLEEAVVDVANSPNVCYTPLAKRLLGISNKESIQCFPESTFDSATNVDIETVYLYFWLWHMSLLLCSDCAERLINSHAIPKRLSHGVAERKYIEKSTGKKYESIYPTEKKQLDVLSYFLCNVKNADGSLREVDFNAKTLLALIRCLFFVKNKPCFKLSDEVILHLKPAIHSGLVLIDSTSYAGYDEKSSQSASYTRSIGTIFNVKRRQEELYTTTTINEMIGAISHTVVNRLSEWVVCEEVFV